MLVKPRHTAVNAGRIVAELNRAVQHDGRAVMVVVNADKHFARRGMRIVNPVRRIVNGPYRYLVAKGFDYFGGGA
jgi:hypothetical protein